MDYKSIMVCLDNGRHNAARMNFAIDLAVRHDAHLTGLHVTHSPTYPYTPEGGLDVLIAKLEQDQAARAKVVERDFTEAARRAGARFDWAALSGYDAYLAVERARAADLVVVGQADPEDPETASAEGFPESIVMGTGKPTLLVPWGQRTASPFERVIIGWNGGREAARAMGDALPLLARASAVFVLTVESAIDDRAPGTLPGVDVAAFLSRHGIKAEVVPTSKIDIAVGEWLLSRAADLSADLLVTGAYGHSRMREFVLGGVTRTLLRSMTVPVLMSH